MEWITRRLPFAWPPYGAAILLVVGATGIGELFPSTINPINLVVLYLLAVVIAGLRCGRGPAVLTSVLGVLAFDVFFVPPILRFTVHDAEYLITFGALLVVALVIGSLTGQLRENASTLRLREQETAALYSFTRRMVGVRDLAEIGRAVVDHAGESFRRPVAVLLGAQEKLELLSASPGFHLTEEEYRAASSAFRSGEPIGWAEGTEAPVGCLPLRTRSTLGVLVLRHPDHPAHTGEAELHLLGAMAAQVAVAVEREQFALAARRAEFLEESERLHDALLHSISHAIRTPLVTVIGSLSALSEQRFDANARQALIETAREEAERLNWLVSNLLDMTRLESGPLKLNLDWYDPEDVVGVALRQTAGSLKGHPLQVQMEEHLPLIRLDQVLFAQVLDNLLTNAAKYSPPGDPVEVQVGRVAEGIEFRVSDRGPGIPVGERERVFDKFYRLERPGDPSGTGLGLAICKGVVEAHRGRIRIEERSGGGTAVHVALPVAGPEERGTPRG